MAHDQHNVSITCRTCMTKTDKCQSLFATGEFGDHNTKLSYMLEEICSSLKFEEDDGMPTQMCRKCAIQVTNAFTFKLQCLRSDAVLRESLNIPRMKRELASPIIHVEDELDDEPTEYSVELIESDIHDILEDVNSPLMNIGPITVVSLPTEAEQLAAFCDDNVSDELIPLDDCQEPEADNESALLLGLDTADGDKAKVHEILHRKLRKRTKRGPQPPFKCEICTKMLSNSSSYKYHMQLHSQETPYLCPECGEGFKTRNAFLGHKITHSSNNPHTCEICGKSYRQAASLRSHKLSHTGEKPFLCGICGKGMTQKSGFKKHMLTHTGEKPHRCEECGKNFRYSSNLIMHKRCHTGLKPFSCLVCNARFPCRDQLKRHHFIHSGLKPFTCDVCGKSFNRKSTLRVHRKLHTTEKTRSNSKRQAASVQESY